MPHAALSAKVRPKAIQQIAYADEEPDPSTPSGNNEQQFHYRRVQRPSLHPIDKAKPGEYALAIFSASGQRSRPFIIRLLDFAYMVVHIPALQFVDCLLSVYISLLIILKVPRHLQLDFESTRSIDLSTLFVSSYTICLVVFFFELILEVLAMYSNHSRNQQPGHKKGFFNFAVDLVVCCSLAAEIISYLIGDNSYVNLVGLRVFKIFKYLRFWNDFSDLDNILESVYDSMAMMANIFSSLIVTLVLYCIIAVQLFSDTYYNACTIVQNNTSFTLVPAQYCDASSQCPKGFDCVESIDNLPAMGTYAFDNSWNALIQLIQVVLPDNWPPIIMNAVAQANPSIIVIVRFYFYSLVVFDALVLLNLCIAVMSFAFQRIRDSTKKLEPEPRVEDPKLQSLKVIALELNPSIFSKHVKRSFLSKLSSNVVVPEETMKADADEEYEDPAASPPAPTESTQNPGFRRKTKQSPSPSPAASNFAEQHISRSTWAKFHYFCLHLASLPAFEYFIIVIVSLNCLTLAMTHRGMSESFTSILDIVEFIFTGIFLFEMILKIIAFGPRKYLMDNWFDFLVVAFSLIEILTTYAFSAQQLPNLTVLRMFRVLRIFRALKRIKKLMQVLGMIFKSGAALRNLLIFVFVWFSAVAAVGKELFGNRDLLAGASQMQVDRMNFDNILNSFEILFRLATGDSWSSLMHKFMLLKYDSILIHNEPKLADPLNTAPAVAFFVSFYLFSNFILINVLVSIILENFEVSNVDRAEEFMSMLTAEDEDIRDLHKSSFGDAKASVFEWIMAKQEQEQVYVRKIALYKRHVASSTAALQSSSVSSPSTENVSSPSSDRPSQEDRPKTPLSDKGANLSRSYSSFEFSSSSSKTLSSAILNWKPSVFDRVRIVSHTVLKSTWYPYILYGTICLSSLTLAFTPAKHETTILDQPPWTYINIVFWFIFFMEFVFNVCLTPVSYFCMGWNLLDFIILVMTSIDLLGTLDVISLKLTFFRVIRLVRALRPLRMLNKNENIRNVVNTVIGSLSSVAYVVALYLILCLMFSVVALQLFSAKMDYCNDDSSVGYHDCTGAFLQTPVDTPNVPLVLMPRAWSTARSNFDDAGRGMIALFRLSTMQWSKIYFTICDISDEDVNTKQNANTAQGLFIILFVVISGYFIINMFVAVIVEFFKTSSGSRLLTPWQKSWVQTRRFISALKFETPAPKGKLRHALYRIVHHTYFELLISGVIFANGLVMLLQSRNQSAEFERITAQINDIALFIFIIEMIVKIIAFGPLTYCRDNWNLFDASLVIFSITMNYFIDGSTFESAGQLLRLLRLFRLLRLIRQFRSFTILWDAFVISLWPILNIFLLIFLFFWIYSVIGVSQFGHTRPGRSWVGSGFESFPRTFLTLSNLVAGEDWDNLFDDVSVQYPYCTEDLIGSDGEVLVVGDCGNQVAATLYFILFILVVQFVLMNLFLAVVVENFSICFEPIEGLIEQRHVDHFLKVFACFCHKEHKFSSLHEYLNYWNSLKENERDSVYGDPADLLHRSHLRNFLEALRVNPDTGERSGMTGYSNPLGGHLLGYHGRRHYLCVRAEVDLAISERMLREAPLSQRIYSAIAEKWRMLNKKVFVWWMKLTRRQHSSSSHASNTLAERKAIVLKRFRKAAHLVYRQKTGNSFTDSNKSGWESMVEQLRLREQERAKNSLSREELFKILVTWSVPVSHLTEIERRKRQEIVDHFHRQSAQQLIHAMFVGKKVRAERRAATTSSKRKFKGAAKMMSKTSSRPAVQSPQETDNFEEIECIRRLSSKPPNQITLAAEQEAFVRTCLKSKSQIVSSKKLLEKIRQDCLSSHMKLAELACDPGDTPSLSPKPTSPQPSVMQTMPTQQSSSTTEKAAANNSIPGTTL